MLSNDGVSYRVPNWTSGETFSACVKTHLSDGTYTYNISKDGVVIAQNQTGSSYTYTENDNGFHEYHLTTNYFSGESQLMLFISGCVDVNYAFRDRGCAVRLVR